MDLGNLAVAWVTPVFVVGGHEADARNGSLSVTPPLARALIGKTLGGSVEVTTPKGPNYYQFADVTFK